KPIFVPRSEPPSSPWLATSKVGLEIASLNLLPCCVKCTVYWRSRAIAGSPSRHDGDADSVIVQSPSIEGTGGVATTVTCAVAVASPDLAAINAAPGATASTNPFSSTFATAESLLVHATSGRYACPIWSNPRATSANSSCVKSVSGGDVTSIRATNG